MLDFASAAAAAAGDAPSEIRRPCGGGFRDQVLDFASAVNDDPMAEPMPQQVSRMRDVFGNALTSVSRC